MKNPTDSPRRDTGIGDTTADVHGPDDPAIVDAVCGLVADTLGLGSRPLKPDTPLIGHMVEFDSMAVVAIITALEEHYGFLVDDDELSASVFEDIASLSRFVSLKSRR